MRWVAVLLIASFPALAHHGGANYDIEHPITLTGTVTQFELINPHSLLRFCVKNADGTVANWLAVWAPPQVLMRMGWRADTLKPGDRITITGGPAKDGHKSLSPMRIVGESGKVLFAAEGGG